MGAHDDRLMQARLVYDGGDAPPTIPPEMGTPKEGQFAGTPREQTAELCGRVCYDSLGKGRASDAYHAHIHEVRHYSVYEHTPFTVEFGLREEELTGALLALANRPGIWTRVERRGSDGYRLRVTANFRAVIEWDRWPVAPLWGAPGEAARLRHGLALTGQTLAPMIVRYTAPDGPYPGDGLVAPKYPEEQWVTLFMAGSRGFSHEQVRHGDFTAVSQRSTRFVDESTSPWVRHPLILHYCADTKIDPAVFEAVEIDSQGTKVAAPVAARNLYDQTVERLQQWMLDKGVNKFDARKQARGAARGYLGNALYTEMMFSASVAQWHRMIDMRASQFADAEIRQVYADPEHGVIRALQQSRYGDQFQCYVLQPAPDGIGYVAVRRN